MILTYNVFNKSIFDSTPMKIAVIVAIYQCREFLFPFSKELFPLTICVPSAISIFTFCFVLQNVLVEDHYPNLYHNIRENTHNYFITKCSQFFSYNLIYKLDQHHCWTQLWARVLDCARVRNHTILTQHNRRNIVIWFWIWSTVYALWI